LEVVYHGISAPAPSSSRTSRDEVRTRLGIETDKTVFMTIANMRVEKNLGLLIRAFANSVSEEPNARLVLVGDGVERPRLEELVATLGLTNLVVFTGRVPQARSMLVAADVAAMSSEHEGLPVFMMECLAAGIPIVSTEVGGVGELLVNGVNGILVPPGDEQALANALTRMCRDSSLRRELARGALMSSERFSIAVAADRLSSLYDQMLRNRAAVR
jgi:glycosyltransferase involved in cell wall biosynthesis